MSETIPSLFGEAFRAELRDIVKEAIQAASQNGHQTELLTAEKLAERLQVPAPNHFNHLLPSYLAPSLPCYHSATTLSNVGPSICSNII